MENSKKYFRPGADLCCDLDFHLTGEDEEIELVEAIPVPGGWCHYYESPIDQGDCGKHCGGYEPISKFFRKCVENGQLYEHGKTVFFNGKSGLEVEQYSKP